jgi:hypothetical protein
MSADLSVSHQGTPDCLASCSALQERNSPLVVFSTYVGKFFVERLIVQTINHGYILPEPPKAAHQTLSPPPQHFPQPIFLHPLIRTPRPAIEPRCDFPQPHLMRRGRREYCDNLSGMNYRRGLLRLSVVAWLAGVLLGLAFVPYVLLDSLRSGNYNDPLAMRISFAWRYDWPSIVAVSVCAPAIVILTAWGIGSLVRWIYRGFA